MFNRKIFKKGEARDMFVTFLSEILGDNTQQTKETIIQSGGKLKGNYYEKLSKINQQRN